MSKKKRKKSRENKSLAVAIIVFLVMLIATLLYYFMVFSKPEKTVGRIIDKLSDSYQNAISYNYDITPTVSNANSEKISDNMVDAINYMNVSVNAQSNAENMDMMLNITSTYKKEKLVNMKVLTNPTNKETLLFFEDIIDTHIMIDVDDKIYSLLSMLLNGKSAERQESQNTIKDELSNILKTEYYNSENVKINIQGKSLRAKKHTFTIENIEETDANVELNIYTNGLLNNKIVMVELNIYKKDSTIKTSIDTSKMKKNDGIIYVSSDISDLGQFEFNIEYSKNDDTQFNGVNVYAISRSWELSEEEQKVIYSNIMGTKLYEILDKQGLIKNKFELTNEEIEKYKNMKNMHKESITGTIIKVETSTP